MKTYINGMKAEMKKIKESLNIISSAEKAQSIAKNCREYDKAMCDSQTACLEMMQAAKEIVHLASAIGCCCNLYDIRTIHEVVERKL